MGLYSGINNWVDQIYQFEQTDPVQGGDDGIDNRPLKELADRTTWLKDDIGKIIRVPSTAFFNTDGSITSAMAGHFIMVQATSVITLTLPDAASLPYGSLIYLSSYCNVNGAINIQTQGGQLIEDFISGSTTVTHMHHREHLTLISLLSNWKIVSATGNFYTAGEEVKGRKEILNTLALKGQLVSRSLYPRLWKYVESLTMNNEVVAESTWFSHAFNYRGCFSTGDGATNFRLPDERGMFERMLDAGRGVDFDRSHNFAGGYESDSILSHTHPYRDRYLAENTDRAPIRESVPGGYNNNIGSGATDFNNTSFFYYDATTGANTGLSETRPKNVGKLTLIRY